MNTARRAASEDGSKKDRKKRSIPREIVSYFIIVAVAVLIALFWKKYVATKIEVISGSMKDTLQIGDRLMSSKLPYLFSEPDRGDIVVFYFPDDETQIFIKRLIGLPGETIELVDGYVYIDGILLDEDYVKGDREGNFGPYQIPQDEYFMLGDNRLHSGDSREWNDKTVSMEQIIGKGLFLYKPKLKSLY